MQPGFRLALPFWSINQEESVEWLPWVRVIKLTQWVPAFPEALTQSFFRWAWTLIGLTNEGRGLSPHMGRGGCFCLGIVAGDCLWAA